MNINPSYLNHQIIVDSIEQASESLIADEKSVDKRLQQCALQTLKELVDHLEKRETLQIYSSESLSYLNVNLENLTEKMLDLAQRKITMISQSINLSQSIDPSDVGKIVQLRDEATQISDIAHQLLHLSKAVVGRLDEADKRRQQKILTLLSEQKPLKSAILEIAKGEIGEYPPCPVEKVCNLFRFIGYERGISREYLAPLQSAPFSFQELKTGCLQPPTPPENMSSAILSLQKGELHRSTKSVLAKLPQLFEARNFCLHNIEYAYSVMCTEIDRGADFSVSTKYFPNTACWWVGTAQFTIDRKMIEIGQKFGIQVLSHQQTQRECKNDKISFYSKCEEIFPQDYLEPSASEIRLLAMPDRGIQIQFEDCIRAARQRRDAALWGGVEEKNSPCNKILCLGKHWDSCKEKNGASYLPLELASICNIASSMNLTYSEGGNVVWAEKEGKPHLLIGKDSADFSKKILERQLGREMTEEELIRAFAVDYGVKMDAITFVEQPGDFHLDMSIAAVGDGEIILNDSLAALETEITAQIVGANFDPEEVSLEQIIGIARNIVQLEKQGELNDDLIYHLFEKLRPLIQENDLFDSGNEEVLFLAAEACRKAVTCHRFEAKAKRDIEGAGFRVKELAGRFFEVDAIGDRNEVANFFNTVTAAQGRDKLVVMNGCRSAFTPHQEMIKEEFRRHHTEIEFEELNAPIAEAILRKLGGISCVTKSLGKKL